MLFGLLKAYKARSDAGLVCVINISNIFRFNRNYSSKYLDGSGASPFQEINLSPVLLSRRSYRKVQPDNPVRTMLEQ